MSKLPNEAYWRYKKDVPPEEEFPGMNGEVKVVKKPAASISKLPHPLKCSKCEYIAPSRADLRQHWFDH